MGMENLPIFIVDDRQTDRAIQAKCSRAAAPQGSKLGGGVCGTSGVARRTLGYKIAKQIVTFGDTGVLGRCFRPLLSASKFFRVDVYVSVPFQASDAETTSVCKAYRDALGSFFPGQQMRRKWAFY